MSLKQDVSNAVTQWKLLSFDQRIEQLVVFVLSALILLMVLAALWNLTLRVIAVLLLSQDFDPTRYEVFQSIFGAMLTVMIAMAFKRSILIMAERQDTIFQVKTVILIALLAVLRKFIVMDLQTTDATKVLSLSAAALTLGAVYYAVRKQDADLANTNLDTSRDVAETNFVGPSAAQI